MNVSIYSGLAWEEWDSEEFAQIGSGAEGTVYELEPGWNVAVKLWKGPEHEDFAGTSAEDLAAQNAAVERLTEYPKRVDYLLQTQLPSQVLGPISGVYSSSNSGQMVGFVMPRVQGPNLKELGERIRDHAMNSRNLDSANSMLEVFRDLHSTVVALHAAGVVIGDFNPRNVLVAANRCYLIDVDSMQFGEFQAQNFIAEYVDPLVCKAGIAPLTKCAPYSRGSDWYTFAALLFEALTGCRFFGGRHIPREGEAKVGRLTRPLQRLSVFDPAVGYPDSAVPFANLTQEVTDYFVRLVHLDVRDPFPRQLLDDFRWRECPCGALHARARCPSCEMRHLSVRSPMETKPITTSWQRVFSTPGVILASALQSQALRWVYYKDGLFHRENGVAFLQSELNHSWDFRIFGEHTLAGSGRSLSVVRRLAGNDATGPFVEHTIENYPVDRFSDSIVSCDANENHAYWAYDREFYFAEKRRANPPIATLPKGRVAIWAGPRFGLGYVLNRRRMAIFVYDSEHPEIVWSPLRPSLEGELIDSTCYLTAERAWLFTTIRLGKECLNYCYVLNSTGKCCGQEIATAGDNSWLGSIRPKAAFEERSWVSGEVVHCLYSPAINGMVRVFESDGRITQSILLKNRVFSGLAFHSLHVSTNGGRIYTVGLHDIHCIELRR